MFALRLILAPSADDLPSPPPHSWFTNYYDQIVSSKKPEDIRGDDEFTEMLISVLQDHNAVIQTMALGVIELQVRGRNGSRGREE
jgi:hypothetical protein